VFFSGRPPWWQALRKTGLVVMLASTLLVSCGVESKEPAPDTVTLLQLPTEAQTAHERILQGGPFPYHKDGAVFGNRERQLPAHARGFYREYTVSTPGSRDRGARRIVCGGREATRPQACFYTADHYNSFRRIVP
jgi:ribonuclease T1